MANEFSTVQLNRSFEGRVLVRISPKINIIEDLVVHNVNGALITYKYQSLYNLSYETEDCSKYDYTTSEPLTWVTSLTMNYRDAYFDEDTKILYVTILDKTNYLGIVVTQHLFYSNVSDFVTYEDPEDNSTPLRNWEGRLVSAPTFDFSVSNILSGLVTINTSEISLANADKALSHLTSPKYSFWKKDVRFWKVLDRKENVSKYGWAVTSGISLDDTVFKISLTDPLEKLNVNATMGDIDSECTLYPESFDTVGSILDPAFFAAPVPYVTGSVTREGQLVTDYTSLYADLEYGITMAQVKDMLPAMNIHYAETDGSTPLANNWYICCRAKDLEWYLINAVSVSYASAGNPKKQFTFTTTADDQRDLYHGDSFTITISGSNYTAFVEQPMRDPTNLTVRARFYTSTPADGTYSNCSIARQKIPCVVVVGTDSTNKERLMLVDPTYLLTLQYDTTGGNKAFSIYFSPFFRVWDGRCLSQNDKVYFRCSPSTRDFKETFYELFDQAGISYLTTSFDTANTQKNSPKFNLEINSSDSYISYLQRMLSSTATFLYVTGFQIGIQTIASGVTKNFDEDVVNNLQYSVDYNDMVMGVRFKFEKYFQKQNFSKTGIESIWYNPDVTQLHDGSPSMNDFVSVAEDYTESQSEIAGHMTSPNRKFSFIVPRGLFDGILGYRGDLTSTLVPGYYIKVLGLNKEENSVKIEATDMDKFSYDPF